MFLGRQLTWVVVNQALSSQVRLKAFIEDVSPKDILGHLPYNFTTSGIFCNILQWKLDYKSKCAVRNENIGY